MNRTSLRIALMLAVSVSCVTTVRAQLFRGRPAEQDQQSREERRRRLRGVFERIVETARTGEEADAAGRPDEASGEEPGNRAAPNLLNGLLPLLPQFGGGRQATEPLDPARLNQAIEEEIATPLVEEIEPLESLQLRIDEQHTDFARDRLGLDGRMQLRSTPWQAPASLGLHLHASLENRPRQGTRAVISVDVDLLTDTVALFEFARQRAARQLRGRPEPAELLALVESTPPFRTLGDVADFLPRMGEVNLRTANHKVLALQSQLAQPHDPAEEKRLIDELAHVLHERDNLLAFSIRSRRNELLDVDQIEVVLPGGGISYQFADIESVHMVITPDQLNGQVSLSFGQAGVLLYRGAKAVIVEPALRRIQQRDPATLESLRDRGRQLGEQLEITPSQPESIEELPPPE